MSGIPGAKITGGPRAMSLDELLTAGGPTAEGRLERIVNVTLSDWRTDVARYLNTHPRLRPQGHRRRLFGFGGPW